MGAKGNFPCCQTGQSEAEPDRAASNVGTPTFEGIEIYDAATMGHKHIGTIALFCDVSEDTLRKAVEMV